MDQMDLQQLQAALQAAEQHVTPQQLLEIWEFVDRIGGMENARAALELLGELPDVG